MATPNKIAFLCHPYHRGGATRWMADAAMAYANKGYEVYFATLDPVKEFFSGKKRETMLQLLQHAGKVKVGSIKVGREFEFGTPEYCAYIYKKLILENIPQGVPIILSDDKTVWQAANALHNTYPIVGVLHSDEENYYYLAKKYTNQTDIFVSVSARVSQKVLAENPQIAPGRVFTIPCGIELPKMIPRRKSGDILNLVYVGRITDYQKRVSDLGDVALLLKKKNIPFLMNIIGDGLEPKVRLEQKIKDTGLEKEVSFLGWLSQAEVHNYLSSSDVLVLTSDFEGMPIAMMEGLAAGCGFTGTRVSGIEDYENHPLARDCFRVFEVGDIEDAVRKIQQVAAVPLQTRQQSARMLAESQFSMDSCLENYSKAIGTIPKREYTPGNNAISAASTIKSRLIATLRTLKMTILKK